MHSSCITFREKLDTRNELSRIYFAKSVHTIIEFVRDGTGHFSERLRAQCVCSLDYLTSKFGNSAPLEVVFAPCMAFPPAVVDPPVAEGGLRDVDRVPVRGQAVPRVAHLEQLHHLHLQPGQGARRAQELAPRRGRDSGKDRINVSK